MPLLHIALEEGFSGDAVLLRVDGRTVFDRQDVRTRTQIGLAAKCEVPLAVGEHTVEILLPQRQLSRAIPVSLDRDTFLALSVNDQSVEAPRISTEPFFYA